MLTLSLAKAPKEGIRYRWRVPSCFFAIRVYNGTEMRYSSTTTNRGVNMRDTTIWIDKGATGCTGTPRFSDSDDDTRIVVTCDSCRLEYSVKKS